jgi:hypothetical protein
MNMRNELDPANIETAGLSLCAHQNFGCKSYESHSTHTLFSLANTQRSGTIMQTHKMAITRGLARGHALVGKQSTQLGSFCHDAGGARAVDASELDCSALQPT